MKKKVSESEFARMMNQMGIWTHKFADKMQCPKCFTLLFKSDRAVDYEIIINNVVSWVEVKQAPERFAFANPEAGIRPGQQEFLDDWTSKKAHCWIFLVMGPGSAPKERKAWLIPWEDYKEVTEYLDLNGMKSIPWAYNRMSKDNNAQFLFERFEISWKSGWVIPDGHKFKEIHKL